MKHTTNHDQAIELLQDLGLKEYEAKAFVSLTRLPHGTAKDISEISDVPRTRVYDAVRELESKGLVEIQHASPQQFRAVPIEEAADILHNEFETRTDELRETLHGIDSVATDSQEVTHEVWALSGHSAIVTRTLQLIDDAEREIVIVIGDDMIVTDALMDRLHTANDRGVRVIIGAISEQIRARVQRELSDAEVFVSGLEWLSESPGPDDDTTISQLLLVDEQTILVSTFRTSAAGSPAKEQAIFGQGFDNGLVTIARRLMATGRLESVDSEPELQ